MVTFIYRWGRLPWLPSSPGEAVTAVTFITSPGEEVTVVTFITWWEAVTGVTFIAR